MVSRATDKRLGERVKTLFAGHAIIAPGLPDVLISVKDLSPTGARLTLDPRSVLPDRFELWIPKKNVRRRALVRWRDGMTVGVEFEPATDAIDDPHQRIAELEADNARLRRRIAEMAERLFAYGDTEVAPY